MPRTRGAPKIVRDIRELTGDPEAYAAELRRRWGGLLSYRYIGRSHGSMDTGPVDDTVTLRRDMRNPTGGLLLAVLEPGPLHGYAIINAVQERSGGALELRTGTIYPALNRLERLGLLESHRQSVGERHRRCYALTDAGHRALAQERTSWA